MRVGSWNWIALVAVLGWSGQVRAGPVPSQDPGPELWARAASVLRPGDGPGPLCGTPTLFEVWRRMDEASGPWRRRLRDLYLPPPDFQFYVDATDVFPVRVSYSDPSQEALARAVASAVQVAYRKEVEELGFWRPPIESPDGLYRMYIDDLGDYVGGYTAPYARVPETERSDAYTYIVINARQNPEYVLGVVAHEFNHACQSAMDSLEPPAFMENTAVYVESYVSRIDWIYAAYMMQAFQAYPYLPLEFMGRGMAYGYEYGGVLWVYFLDEVYGSGDATFVRQIWENTIQPDGQVNEPDYFDTIDAMTADRGGMEEAVRLFSEYRFFMARDDDGAHLPDAKKLWDTEVARQAVWKTSDLPVLHERFADTALPMANGCNYIELQMDTWQEQTIRFSFRGYDDVLWHVGVIRAPWEGEGTMLRMELDEDHGGSLDVDPEPWDRLVLVVCQLGGPDYDPDRPNAVRARYEYSIEAVPPAPRVFFLEPGSIRAGTQLVPMVLEGDGFVRGEGLRVSFSGEGVVAEVSRYVSPGRLEILVTAAAWAEPGLRDVVVTNPGGRSGIGQGVLEVLARSDESGSAGGDVAEPPGAGRGCHSMPLPGAWFWLLAPLVAWWRRR